MDRETINKLAGSVYVIWNEPEKPKPYQEYPKLVYLADGSYVRVENAEEEKVARGEAVFSEETQTIEPVSDVQGNQPEKDKDPDPQKKRGRPRKNPQ